MRFYCCCCLWNDAKVFVQQLEFPSWLKLWLKEFGNENFSSKEKVWNALVCEHYENLLPVNFVSNLKFVVVEEAQVKNTT